MLRGAQTRIQDWWAQAYDGVLGERFRLEAQASLPLVGDGAGVEEVYAGVRVQRLRLSSPTPCTRQGRSLNSQ